MEGRISATGLKSVELDELITATANINALLAMDLANNKNWIIFGMLHLIIMLLLIMFI